MSRAGRHNTSLYADDDDLALLDSTELGGVSAQYASRGRRRTDYGRAWNRADNEDSDLELDELEEEANGARSKQRPAGDDESEDVALLEGSSRQVTGGLPAPRAQRDSIWRRIIFWRKAAVIALVEAQNESEDDHDPSSNRLILVGAPQSIRYPPNAISNAKYTPWSFLPRTLWNEFKFFFNTYFLLVALSQIIPALRIGYLSTYIAPLAFVLFITLGKEAHDDVLRRRRDGEANGEAYKVLRFETGGDVAGGRKRKIKSMSERKRGKRQRVASGTDGRLAAVDREEEAAESVDAPSASVVEIMKPSKDLKVGDVVVLGKDQRVPADLVILKSFAPVTGLSSSDIVALEGALVELGDHAVPVDAQVRNEASSGQTLDNATTTEDPSGGGEAFIRTDQLDGETDWKLRLACPLTQTLSTTEFTRLRVTAGKPDKRVNEFVGTIELLPKPGKRVYDPHLGRAKSVTSPPSSPVSPAISAPLTLDNTAWANTVLASGTTVLAVVIYTGPQTRAALSTSASRSKTGLLEHEINSLTKILCVLTAALSLLLVALERYEAGTDEQRRWYVTFMRFLILFSTIVPISLRVNLDMGKSVYAWMIHRDDGIPGTVVRTSTIPEDLGRIEYLLTDKTGTLTMNVMELKKVHIGTVSYGGDAMEEVERFVKQAFDAGEVEELWTPAKGATQFTDGGATRTRRELSGRVRDLVLALALCHNVTPTTETDADGEDTISYQASSPDEIAIVQWTQQVGLGLVHRDRRTISLQYARSGRPVVKVEILHVFPFTSESKRMGIVVRFVRDASTSHDVEGEIVFFQKGADTVMASIVASNDWLDEETDNMAREGLRTLVVGRKTLNKQQYAAFSQAYSEASLSLSNRESALNRVVRQHLEHDLDLLGVTGVEDKLQPHVKPSLELLRNAGIKIWMLTGDKVETARCIAVSAKLVTRGQYIHTIANLKRKEHALEALNALHTQSNAALLIDGQSLAIYLQYHQEAFISLAVRLPAVIACRCSPTQKADVALLIRAFTKKRIACIGDGGNDVSMIQAADVGIGIVGKEGRQASLAADFSITQFAYVTKLFVWHGRNAYRRSAKLAQFVIHRGLIISVCQTVFSIASKFEPIALYRDWLLVGYASIYTMAPVFSLVLDRDVDEGLANLYPELYKELTTGSSLSYRTFFTWVGISIYQGVVIQGGAELLVPGFLKHSANPEDPAFKRMVAVSYTVLVVNEILMVACEVTTWHPVMIVNILGTAAVFFGSLPFLGRYFDLQFLITLGFWWRFALITATSLIPVYAGKLIRRTIKPPSYRKVRAR